MGHNERAQCTRCDSVIDQPKNRKRSQARAAAAAVAAMVLFPAAVMLPILEVEQLGHHHKSSILGGIMELYKTGSILVATVILLFSVVFPLFKILALVELSWLCLMRQRHRTWTYRFMEQIGKWSMMDVMLLALLVMLIKLSGIVQFHFGPALIAFVLCVSMSMISAICFDPHAIWETP
ncbi:MAG: paraquat-inducible protein A [Planctomycetota bacterium]|nr:paraquat-inducible protein A [Planctomycetota bacterium]